MACGIARFGRGPRPSQRNLHRARGEQQRHKRRFGRGSCLRQGTYERGSAGPRGRRPWALRLSGNSVRRRADLGKTFDGEASYGAALIGYQFRTQALFLKLFAGVEAEDQSITPRDLENSVQGGAVGLKLAAESWLDLSPLWFLGAWRGGLSPFATLLTRSPMEQYDDTFEAEKPHTAEHQRD